MANVPKTVPTPKREVQLKPDIAQPCITNDECEIAKNGIANIFTEDNDNPKRNPFLIGFTVLCLGLERPLQIKSTERMEKITMAKF